MSLPFHWSWGYFCPISQKLGYAEALHITLAQGPNSTSTPPLSSACIYNHPLDPAVIPPGQDPHWEKKILNNTPSLGLFKTVWESSKLGVPSLFSTISRIQTTPIKHLALSANINGQRKSQTMLFVFHFRTKNSILRDLRSRAQN